jgi:ankyrin repeat protein
VKLLLDKKEQVSCINEQDSGGGYPLLTAVRDYYNDRHQQIVEMLLQAGARTDLKDNEGKSLLMVARSATIANLLLKNINIENINIQDYDGRCALLHAMTWGYFEVVEVLLENGVDPDLVADDGSSATSVIQAMQVCGRTPCIACMHSKSTV